MPEQSHPSPFDSGPFDPDELVRWAEHYGHPKEWAKRAQAAHMRAERAEETRENANAVSIRLEWALRRLEHLLSSPGGMTPAELQTEGLRIIREVLSR